MMNMAGILCGRLVMRRIWAFGTKLILTYTVQIGFLASFCFKDKYSFLTLLEKY